MLKNRCIIRKWTYILLVDDHDEVAMYHQQTKYFQQTTKQTKVIQEVVSSEVSELNHVIMNKNKEIKRSFLQKKD